MDPIGRPLNPEEQALLTVLSQDGRAPTHRTTTGLALALERDPIDIASVLSRLERDHLVTREVETDEEFWTAAAAA